MTGYIHKKLYIWKESEFLEIAMRALALDCHKVPTVLRSLLTYYQYWEAERPHKSLTFSYKMHEVSLLRSTTTGRG